MPFKLNEVTMTLKQEEIEDLINEAVIGEGYHPTKVTFRTSPLTRGGETYVTAVVQVDVNKKEAQTLIFNHRQDDDMAHIKS